MNIFKRLVEYKNTIKDLRASIAKQDERVKEYNNLVYRFLSVSKIPSFPYPFSNGSYDAFDAYVTCLEERAAKDAERDKIRDYIKEIQAEAAHEDKRPS